MIQFMSSRMIQIFAFKIDTPAVYFGQTFTKIYRRRTALKMLAYRAQFAYKLVAFAYGIIGIRNFIHFFLQLIGHKRAAVFAEITFFIRKLF